MANKRSLVIAELKRRLTPLSTKIIEGRGAIWGVWANVLPAIHLFEYASERELIKPGLCVVTFPVHIEYVTKLGSQDLLYTEGRTRLEQIRSAVELDERFTRNKNLISQAEDICIDYYCASEEIITPVDKVVDAGVLYIFRFTEPFLGYEVEKH